MASPSLRNSGFETTENNFFGTKILFLRTTETTASAKGAANPTIGGFQNSTWRPTTDVRIANRRHRCREYPGFRKPSPVPRPEICHWMPRRLASASGSARPERLADRGTSNSNREGQDGKRIRNRIGRRNNQGAGVGACEIEIRFVI